MPKTGINCKTLSRGSVSGAVDTADNKKNFYILFFLCFHVFYDTVNLSYSTTLQRKTKQPYSVKFDFGFF